jgi:uncharacterized protein (TIGR03083 family)
VKPVEPIFVVDLFQALHTELLSLLLGLSAEDWQRPTVADQWRVRDLAAHLLDSDIRRLSFQRDGLPLLEPETPLESYRDLVGFLNQLNADWIKAAKRISPRLLIEMLSITGPQVGELFASLDPYGPALFSVAWAGEAASENWFDIAREYTEKWHHQQQIREAVGAPGLTNRQWLYPVLDTFLRGLPHTYRALSAPDGTRVLFRISGEAGGDWTLQREAEAWRLYAGACSDAVCEARLDQNTAWRLLTKGLSQAAAAERIEFSGAPAYGQPLFGMLSVMA